MKDDTLKRKLAEYLGVKAEEIHLPPPSIETEEEILQEAQAVLNYF